MCSYEDEVKALGTYEAVKKSYSREPYVVESVGPEKVRVLAPDTHCCVEVTLSCEPDEKRSSARSLDVFDLIRLEVIGSEESSYTREKNYYDSTSWINFRNPESKLSQKFFKDLSLLRNILGEYHVKFKAKVFNSLTEGNLDYLVSEGVRALLKSGTLVRQGSEYPLVQLLNVDHFPHFGYHVVVNGRFVYNPTRAVSDLKQGYLYYYYNAPQDKLLSCKFFCNDTETLNVKASDLAQLIRNSVRVLKSRLHKESSLSDRR